MDCICNGRGEAGNIFSLCCYSTSEMPSLTQHGQVTSPACILPLRLAPVRTLDATERGKVETERSHLMTYSSESAPKTTALGAIMGHHLSLAVLLQGCTTEAM